MHYLLYLLLYLFLLLPLSFIPLSAASAAEVKTSGYLKSYNIIQDEIDNAFLSAPPLYQSKNSGRFMLELFAPSQVWQFHYEIEHESNSHLGAIPSRSSEKVNYRFSDIRPFIGPSERDPNAAKNISTQNLDRFNVQFQLASGDLTLGRQAITFGSARVINPSDVFLPFELQTRNTEYRAGIDAIRFQKPLGQLNELDFGLILGKGAKVENSAAFIQFKGNVSGKDIQLSAINFKQQNLIAAGLQSAIGSVGFWIEGAYVSGDQEYFRSSAGFDYAFSENIFGLLEYHYNGAGASDTTNYFSLRDDIAYQTGGVFLLAKNYLIPSIHMQLSALTSISLQSIYNIDDHSLFLNYSLNRSLSDNLYLSIAYYFFSGDDIFLATKGSSLSPQLGSEYGANPNSLAFNLSYYF